MTGSITKYLRRYSEEKGRLYLSTTEAAGLLNVSERTLRRIRDAGAYVPECIVLGNHHVYIYTMEDVNNLRAVLAERKVKSHAQADDQEA